MKEINSFELIEVPEGIEASVKARAVTVKGARGTLTKVKCKNESVWRKSCAFEIKDFLRFSSYSGVQASGSRHLHAWQKDHQGADDEYVNNIALKPSMVKLHQNSLISHLLRLRSGLERRSRSPPWGLSAVTSRTCSRASPWWDFNDKRIDEDHGIVMLMMCFVWNLQGPIGLWPRARRLLGRSKKTFFVGRLSRIWVGGVQIPKLSVPYTNHYFSAQKFPNLFFSTKVPKSEWMGQSKPKTKSKFWVKFIKCI